MIAGYNQLHYIANAIRILTPIMRRLSRIYTKKSSSIPTTAKYSAPPVLQPKATKKSPKPLPEWQPGGGGMRNPVQRLLATKATQAKLTIGQPDDKYKQEADAVAKDVVQRLHSPGAEASLQETVQRDSVEQEEEDLLQTKPIVQRSLGGGKQASSELESSINQAKTGGQPLDAGLQRLMGQAMGADFSGVRVHTNGNADRLNQSIQAKAFTTGQDVFFKQGEYQPGTKGGQELIAHELTHVVQQKGAKVQTKKDIAQTTTDRNISSDGKLQTDDIIADVLRSPQKTTSSKPGQQRLPIQYQNSGTEGIINRAVSDKLKKGTNVLVKHNGRWTEGTIYKKRTIEGQVEYYVELTYDAFSRWIPHTSKDIETASIYQFGIGRDTEVDLPKGLIDVESASNWEVKSILM